MKISSVKALLICFYILVVGSVSMAVAADGVAQAGVTEKTVRLGPTSQEMLAGHSFFIELATISPEWGDIGVRIDQARLTADVIALSSLAVQLDHIENTTDSFVEEINSLSLVDEVVTLLDLRGDNATAFEANSVAMAFTTIFGALIEPGYEEGGGVDPAGEQKAEEIWAGIDTMELELPERRKSLGFAASDNDKAKGKEENRAGFFNGILMGLKRIGASLSLIRGKERRTMAAGGVKGFALAGEAADASAQIEVRNETENTLFVYIDGIFQGRLVSGQGEGYVATSTTMAALRVYSPYGGEFNSLIDVASESRLVYTVTNGPEGDE